MDKTQTRQKLTLTFNGLQLAAKEIDLWEGIVRAIITKVVDSELASCLHKSFERVGE